MTLPDLARWLFHTPGRLLAAVLALVVVAAVTMWAFQDATGSPDPAPPAAAASRDLSAPAASSAEPASSLASTPAAVDEEGHGTHRVPAPGPVRRVAATYLRVFLSDTGSTARWHTRLDRLSTDTLARLNATVPRAMVPDATLRRLTLTALSSSYASLHAVLSDGTRLTVALVLDSDGWRVTEVAPEPAR
jgi:hypothetical protein